MDVEIQNKYREKLAKNLALAGNGECQIWCGAIKKSGNYGVMNVNYPGHLNGMYTIVVHRVSSKVNHNTVNLPTDVDVSHLCHNSLCIKAEHVTFHWNLTISITTGSFANRSSNASGKGFMPLAGCHWHSPKGICSFFIYIFSAILFIDTLGSCLVKVCQVLSLLSCQVLSGQVRSGQVRSILYIGDSTHFSVL